MLESLRKYDPREAQRILSSLTSELLPDAEVSTRDRLGIDPNLYSDIWGEIRRRTKLDPSDTSAATRRKLFEFLFSEMSQRALPSFTLEAVKARLSLRGELRPDLYDIKFDQFFEMSVVHGVRPNHVREAIRNADDFEHVNALDGEILLSFFVKTNNEFVEKDSFILLVVALRVGANLEVFHALRVYQSDVDISGASRPHDVLGLLAAKYGFTITVGDITSKLIIDQTTIIRPPIDRHTLVKIHALDGVAIFGDAIVRKQKLHHSFGVALAFALDQEKYAADLRRHGVHVTGGNFRSPNLWTKQI